MGISREGYCKLCASPLAPGLNKLIAEGKNAAECRRTMEPLGLTFTRHTFYAHKEHITHPLQTVVDRAKQNPIIVPKSTTAVLEAIRDLGIKRAIENPDEVTVDHALKAAQILQQGEKKGENILVILAKTVMADVPEDIAGYIGTEPDTIDGEYEEVVSGS